jgi:hypothetical protein
MDNFKPLNDWSRFVENETDIAVKMMAQMVSASTTILNTMASFGNEMYRYAKSLHRLRQQYFDSYVPFL